MRPGAFLASSREKKYEPHDKNGQSLAHYGGCFKSTVRWVDQIIRMSQGNKALLPNRTLVNNKLYSSYDLLSESSSKFAQYRKLTNKVSGYIELIKHVPITKILRIFFNFQFWESVDLTIVYNRHDILDSSFIFISQQMWTFKKRKEEMRSVNPMIYKRSYVGAESGRLYNWQSSSDRSTDGEIKSALPILRIRSRELLQNEPLAKRYLSLLNTQGIGRQGIKLQMKARPGCSG